MSLDLHTCDTWIVIVGDLRSDADACADALDRGRDIVLVGLADLTASKDTRPKIS